MTQDISIMAAQAQRTISSIIRTPSRVLRGLLPIVVALVVSIGSIDYVSAADTKEAAVAEAVGKNGTGGKVLGVREKTAKDGKKYFEVKMLNQGKVVIYRISKD